MTPQEVFEYKLRWRPGFAVDVHSDLVDQCKTWCRRNLQRHQWCFDSYTGIYSHTYGFEKEEHASNFSEQFKEWVGKGRT